MSITTRFLQNVVWVGLVAVAVSGCAGGTRVISTDLTRQNGIYVIGYLDREDIRARLEDSFVARLGDEGIRALASRHDIPRIKQATTTTMIRAANAHSVAAVLIVNRIEADGSGGIIESKRRILPDDPDLRAYFDVTRQEPDLYGNQDPVYAEANAFLIDGTKSRRFWTGTAWTFAGDEDEVIGNISRTIAAEIANAARTMRDYSRPID